MPTVIGQLCGSFQVVSIYHCQWRDGAKFWHNNRLLFSRQVVMRSVGAEQRPGNIGFDLDTEKRNDYEGKVSLFLVAVCIFIGV